MGDFSLLDISSKIAQHYNIRGPPRLPYNFKFYHLNVLYSKLKDVVYLVSKSRIHERTISLRFLSGHNLENSPTLGVPKP
jgi:hypothetical protein